MSSSKEKDLSLDGRAGFGESKHSSKGLTSTRTAASAKCSQTSGRGLEVFFSIFLKVFYF